MKRLFLFLFVVVGFFVYKRQEKLTLWWALQSLPPTWAEEQLARDFSDFKTIDQASLNETFAKVQSAHAYAFRYRVVDGEIYRMGGEDSFNRARIFDKILRRIQKSKDLPNVDFIICVNDGVPESYMPQHFWVTEKQAPIFAWAKRKDIAPYVVLIPDFLTTKESSWHKEVETVNELYLSIPWEARKEVAFWRGTSNDKQYTLENFQYKPRFLISLLAKLRPDLIDAGYARVYPKEVEEKIGEMGLIRGNTPVSGHLSFKYLPVLDGYMCTFPGFQWRLLSGSLTMKQESDEVQYFYSALKPYEHYIPIQGDMSDLLDKIQWAKEHDAECKKIAENARKFALQNLMPDQIYAYLYWVLEKHASLQTFDLHQEPLGPEWKKVF